MPLSKLALESALKIALYGGGPDPFAAPQPAAINAIQVLAEDHSLEGFTGSLTG